MNFFLKDILSTTLSIIVFNDILIDKFLIIGMSMSFIGSIIYSYTKI